MSVLIDFDEKGSILNHRIFKSIIRSCRRFTYNEAWQLLQSNQPNDGNKPTFAALKLMHKLSIILRKKRVLEGSVDFHIPEPEINVSDDGVVQDIFAAENNEAHKLIEEFMLAANQVVAKDLNSRKVPSIHRIHQPPDAIKLENLDTFLSTLGLSLRDPQNVKTSDLQRLVAHATGKPYERAINALILRAMKKAEYSSSNPGHFCLNFDHYSHFTSPIRRYPDLVVHRILKTFMHCEPSANLKKQFISRIKLWAKQSSLREQRAEKVEREIQNLRKAQFMSGKIGRKFNGLITSITAFGFFVELKEHFVEGLVHLSSMMDDYYLFIETEHKLKGRHSFKTFQIGDEVTVRVVNVNLPKRQIELNLSSA
tara:strand:- start:33 stop:1136 length:1104 start_codon:yes stop_codon:yes gene_type:complete